MKKKININNKGFTMVEIIAVIAVLVIVAGIFSVNMIRSLNKNKIEENKNVVNTIKSAADAYVSANPEKLESLYTEKAFIDVELGELRDDGLISENLKDAETGQILNDNTKIRIQLTNDGRFEIVYPIKEEDLNKKSWELKVNPLTVGYGEGDASTWCQNNALKDFGTVNLQIVDFETGNKYTGNTSNIDLKYTSCDVNPKMAGTYNITYQYKDPSTGATMTKDRVVYVTTSKNDIASFTAIINNNKVIGVNATNVPITITNFPKNGGSINQINTTIEKLGEYGYKIEGFKVDQAIENGKATITNTRTNSDGSTISSVTANYKVTDSFASVILDKLKDDPNGPLKNDGYFTGQNPDNNVKYGGKDFKIYYINGNVMKLVYTGNDIKGAYGQIGNCIQGCCNQGRYLYAALGDTQTLVSGSAASNFATTFGFKKNMDEYLNDFYDSLSNKNYLTNMTLKIKYTMQNYQIRVNDRTYNNSENVSNAIQEHEIPTKVALLSKDEYVKIAKCSNETNCVGNTYLNGSHFWLLDPYKIQFGLGAWNQGVHQAMMTSYSVKNGLLFYGQGADRASGSFKQAEEKDGQVHLGTSSVVTDTLVIKPTIQLSNVKTATGSGTADDPYVIK